MQKIRHGTAEEQIKMAEHYRNMHFYKFIQKTLTTNNTLPQGTADILDIMILKNNNLRYA